MTGGSSQEVSRASAVEGRPKGCQVSLRIVTRCYRNPGSVPSGVSFYGNIPTENEQKTVIRLQKDYMRASVGWQRTGEDLGMGEL